MRVAVFDVAAEPGADGDSVRRYRVDVTDRASIEDGDGGGRRTSGACRTCS